MDKITSFTINHLALLEPGVYVSRKDNAGGKCALITTFDIRMTSPNFDEPVMNTADVHTIEHLGATFLQKPSRIGEIRFCTSDPWAAVPVFISCLAGDHTIPKKSFR